MYQIENYLTEDGRDPFKGWLESLADRRARAFALVRVGRMGAGAFGDCKPVGNGVWEARIDYGPGYRVYYARAGAKLILLLMGGDKRRQDADIARRGVLDRLATETQIMSRASRPHDESVIELLREDPAFADEYLQAAMEQADAEGGREALLAALRHVAEAQGMARVAERAGIQRESLYRALSPKGNPTLKTLVAVLEAAGLKLAITRRDEAHA